jgi:hypothetical protein
LPVGKLFTPKAIEMWDALCSDGRHVAAIGGSDDHQGGVGMGAFYSPIGSPTTMVFASELSAAAIIEGIKNGRTVVKLQGPSDPGPASRSYDTRAAALLCVWLAARRRRAITSCLCECSPRAL